jgi:hypothetical protein
MIHLSSLCRGFVYVAMARILILLACSLKIGDIALENIHTQSFAINS